MIYLEGVGKFMLNSVVIDNFMGKFLETLAKQWDFLRCGLGHSVFFLYVFKLI